MKTTGRATNIRIRCVGSDRSRTYREKPPHHRGGGEAGEHVIGAAEVCEVGKDDGLAPALAPHVHLTALGLSGRRVRGVAGGDLHDPSTEAGAEDEAAPGRGGWTRPRRRCSPLLLRHDLNRAQLVALVSGAQLSVRVGAPRIKKPLVRESQGVGVA